MVTIDELSQRVGEYAVLIKNCRDWESKIVRI